MEFKKFNSGSPKSILALNLENSMINTNYHNPTGYYQSDLLQAVSDRIDPCSFQSIKRSVIARSRCAEAVFDDQKFGDQLPSGG